MSKPSKTKKPITGETPSTSTDSQKIEADKEIEAIESRDRECSSSTTSKNPSVSENIIPLDDSILNVIERNILRLCHVERADVHEVAETLNQAQGTEAWTPERVAATLSRARRKLERAGELEAARPDSYHSQETRERYDAIIRDMRKELANLPPTAMFASSRAKLLKTIADVEKMRDEVLLALSGKSSSGGVGALVYVSNLRDGPIAGAIAGEIVKPSAEKTRSGVHPPGVGEQGRRGPPPPPKPS